MFNFDTDTDTYDTDDKTVGLWLMVKNTAVIIQNGLWTGQHISYFIGFMHIHSEWALDWTSHFILH